VSIPSWMWPLLGTLFVVLIGYVSKLAADVSGIKAAREVTCKEHGDRLKSMDDSLTEMRRQVDRLVYRQEVADAHAVEGLHSPTHRERDELLRGLMVGSISLPEIERLICLLREVKLSLSASPEDKMNASQLMGRAEWELAEAKRRLDAN
jgi:hypothetical protein